MQLDREVLNVFGALELQATPARWLGRGRLGDAGYRIGGEHTAALQLIDQGVHALFAPGLPSAGRGLAPHVHGGDGPVVARDAAQLVAVGRLHRADEPSLVTVVAASIAEAIEGLPERADGENVLRHDEVFDIAGIGGHALSLPWTPRNGFCHHPALP